ncbi:alpha/beta fold hydrolase, partial [Plantactinospora solaniradicis]
QLQFAGRADEQVKIRGFRVEPGEVETVLAGHESVGQVAVIVREDQPEVKRLVAYVVPTNGDAEIDVTELREFAAGRLPEYMVPTVVVPLESLPVTVNGKLDRTALPAPESAGQTEGRPPATPTEELLCGLFADILGVAQVPADRSFFDLGGDSLSAMRLVAKIRTVFDAQVSIRDLFAAPTVAGVARSMSGGTDTDGLGLLLPIRVEGDLPPLFCVHPSPGLSWCYTDLASQLPADRPVYGLQARGFGVDERLPETLDEMAADYVAQIRSVQPTGPYHLLGWSFGGIVAHAMATLLQDLGEAVEFLTVLDGYPAGGQERAKAPRGDGRPMPRMQADIMRVNINNIHLAEQFTPACFRGDLLLFVAEDGRGSSSPPANVPDSWTPYVEGTVDSVEIDSDHHGMMRGKPLSEIARLISARLKRADK